MGNFTGAFYAFLGARILFSAIDTIIITSVGWHLYLQTKDPFDLALVGLFQVLPAYVFFIVSGWVVDQISRKTILVVATVIQVAVMVGLALVMQVDDFNKWHVFLLIMCVGSVKAFVSPAMQSILPNIVPAKKLTLALAITNTMWNAALMIGPVIAGLLLAIVDRQTYWILVLLCSAALVCFLLLPRIEAAEKGTNRRFSDLFKGITFLQSNQIVFGSLLLDLLVVLGGSVVALLPIFAADVLNVGAEGLGLLRAMPAIGAVMIGIYLSRYKNEFAETGRTLFYALFVFSFSILLFASTSLLWVACVALFIYGASDMFSVVIRGGIVQHNTPNELRGRVSSINSIFISTSNQLGDFRAGAVAAALGPINTVFIGGATALVVTVWGYRYFPRLASMRSVYADEEPR